MRRQTFFLRPSRSEAYSVAIAQGWPVAGETPYFSAAERDRLRDAVETLAERFFDLPPTERASQWQALSAEVASDLRIGLRLEALRPGLHLEVQNIAPDAPLLESLARGCCELFVALPAERARRRRALLRELNDAPYQLRVAAQSLAERWPEIASLAPDLMRQIVEDNAEQLAVAATNRQWHESNLEGPVQIKIVRQTPKQWARILTPALVILGSLLANALKSTPQPSPNSFRPMPLEVTAEQQREAMKYLDELVKRQRRKAEQAATAFDTPAPAANDERSNVPASADAP